MRLPLAVAAVVLAIVCATRLYFRTDGYVYCIEERVP
jgi:hypothetical protein